MARRALVSAILVLAFIIGVAYAVRVTTLQGADLLFDSGWWLLILAPSTGVLLAGLTTRRDPVIEGDRVLRHDDAAILEHWTHGVGTAVLLVSGISLGFLFVPRLVADQTAAALMMNVHFVAVVMFLFGTFYYGANTLISRRRFAEHLPTGNAFKFTVQHYGRLLGGKHDMPPEAKYFESEKMAYILALAATGTIIVTGLLKGFAHVVDIPGFVMGSATWLHDVATLGMLAFFLAHILFAAILPMGWPMLRSMFTGYVSLEHVEAEHAGWLEELKKDESPTETSDAA